MVVHILPTLEAKIFETVIFDTKIKPTSEKLDRQPLFIYLAQGR